MTEKRCGPSRPGPDRVPLTCRSSTSKLRDTHGENDKRFPVGFVDYFNQQLIACLRKFHAHAINCNRWGRPGDKRLVMELLEDDLEAPLLLIPSATSAAVYCALYTASPLRFSSLLET